MTVCLRNIPRSLTLAALIAAGTPLVAQEQQRQGTPKPEAQIQAIGRLDYMTGNWSGDGWMEMGGRRATFRGSEVVQMKLGGTALLVEGNFFAKIPGQEHEVPVHTTLGVISFDPKTSRYRFTSWLATGTSGERELVLTADGWQWTAKSARGEARYTMKRTEAGEWFEIGERTSDGSTWTKFFEMTLRKK